MKYRVGWYEMDYYTDDFYKVYLRVDGSGNPTIKTKVFDKKEDALKVAEKHTGLFYFYTFIESVGGEEHIRIRDLKKKEKYQQRLDNVLKYFEWNIGGYQCKGIYYENAEFKIPFMGVISLNTVEALLKDLGVME